MGDKHWGKVGVIIQGESDNGSTVDRTISGEYAFVVVSTEEGVYAQSFGVLDAISALSVKHALDEHIERMNQTVPLDLLEAVFKLKDLTDIEGVDIDE